MTNNLTIDEMREALYEWEFSTLVENGTSVEDALDEASIYLNVLSDAEIKKRYKEFIDEK